MEDSRDRARLTAAATPIRLGDVEYRMSPLTDRDISELDEWVRHRYIQLAVDSLPKDTPPEEVTQVRLQATQAALNLTWMSGQGAKILATVDGMTRLLWQSLRREHPDVEYEDLRGQLFSSERLKMVRHSFVQLNQSARSNGRPDKGGRKRRQRRRRRSGRGPKSTGR